MPQQQASLNTVQALLTEQGKTLSEQSKKLDMLQAAFDRHREELPDDYAPRRESDKAFADVNTRINDHEARLRIMEGHLPNVAFTAYKDTTNAREKAQTDMTNARFGLDARTIAMLWGALIMVAGYLVYHLLNLLPLH
jgi:septal ring factor EnvC (AmiA/AmiB activator)